MKKSKESGMTSPFILIVSFRMTLRSKEVKPLEAACAEIIARAKN